MSEPRQPKKPRLKKPKFEMGFAPKGERIIATLHVTLDDAGVFTVSGNPMLLWVFCPDEQKMARLSLGITDDKLRAVR